MKSGCGVCGADLAQPERGRRRRYCSRACQARAYRARRDTHALPPRRPRPRRLTAVGIVRVAVELADRDGLHALSMRRIATELRVATAALYRYFPDRDTLLAEMAELVLAENPPPPTDLTGWRARIGYEARAEWRLYRRHPWMLPLLAQTRPPVGPALLDTLERFFTAVDRPGLDRDEMMAIYLSVSGLVQGLALLPSSEGTQRDSDGAEAFRSTATDLVTHDSHPTLARYFSPDTDRIDLDFDRLLEQGLNLLLDGIDRHLPATADTLPS
ncbi:TetR/AcrR family transcriptional regulator [Nocardia blacklockiae]|uniref:TetR/AcrR family transcriptional regulator n=1 Tax=Nocardia blacklockiae TaxID=480036 RepID=UPI0018946214|nr:TetR/AcrR family transcriptional regulator [Nocardia blacklockiae]MBF6175539.1 helix-turn-helix transcriptional regulator [Nocardia blacklockiae]